MRVLIEAELDAVSAGRASATLNIASLFAAGPGEATVEAQDVTVETTTVGGLSPSNTAVVRARFTSRSA
jgi:hypothetical protein